MHPLLNIYSFYINKFPGNREIDCALSQLITFRLSPPHHLINVFIFMRFSFALLLANEICHIRINTFCLHKKKMCNYFSEQGNWRPQENHTHDTQNINLFLRARTRNAFFSQRAAASSVSFNNILYVWSVRSLEQQQQHQNSNDARRKFLNALIKMRARRCAVYFCEIA